MRNPESIRHARDFRKRLSDSERILWYHLRRSALGTRFRRQHPVGPYIVDFACAELKLAVEADGYQHRGSQLHDHWRDTFLRGKGWTVLRFGNDEIYEDVYGVLAKIRSEVDRLRGQ